MVIALAFAVALNKGSKHLNAFFRAVFYAPVVASVVAVSVVWRYILQKDGLLNSLLAVFGIAGPDWLHDTRYALPALMVMTITHAKIALISFFTFTRSPLFYFIVADDRSGAFAVFPAPGV